MIAPVPEIVPADRDAHRRFLDRYYGAARGVYDVTRAYYLLGRDPLLAELASEPWARLVEIGVGTGRNLSYLKRARPSALFGGVDASKKMLEVAEKRCPFARFVLGFAEDAPYADLLGRPPDRVLFSYCLSMVEEPDRALRHARSQLAPSGEIVVVDFGDLRSAPETMRRAFGAWLETFHVRPLPRPLLERHARRIEEGPLGYYRIARIPAAV